MEPIHTDSQIVEHLLQGALIDLHEAREKLAGIKSVYDTARKQEAEAKQVVADLILERYELTGDKQAPGGQIKMVKKIEYNAEAVIKDGLANPLVRDILLKIAVHEPALKNMVKQGTARPEWEFEQWEEPTPYIDSNLSDVVQSIMPPPEPEYDPTDDPDYIDESEEIGYSWQ